MNLSLNYQLGWYVGEYIYTHYLPTLNTDLLQSRHVVEVSDEDFIEHTRISNILSSTYGVNHDDNKSSAAFEDYKTFNHFLANKYLPKILECNVPKVLPTDMIKFKNGIIDSLWDTDLCSYHLEIDKIEFIHAHKHAWNSIVKLILD